MEGLNLIRVRVGVGLVRVTYYGMGRYHQRSHLSPVWSKSLPSNDPLRCLLAGEGSMPPSLDVSLPTIPIPSSSPMVLWLWWSEVGIEPWACMRLYFSYS